MSNCAQGDAAYRAGQKATTPDGAFAGVELTIQINGLAAGTSPYRDCLDRLAILERFNGQTFLPVPATGSVRVELYGTRQMLFCMAVNEEEERGMKSKAGAGDAVRKCCMAASFATIDFTRGDMG